MSDFFNTAELRWFNKGNIPDIIQGTFNRFQEIRLYPSRMDIYLKFPLSSKVGVKIREGRLEIKTLISIGKEYKFHDQNLGRITTWEKWGHSIDIPVNQLIPPDNMIKVYKKRALVGMVHKKEKIILLYPADDIYNYQKGCIAEVAQVKINNHRYWSVNFETWSYDYDLQTELPMYLDFFLNDMDIDTAIIKYLNPNQALSYPQFLVSLP